MPGISATSIGWSIVTGWPSSKPSSRCLRDAVSPTARALVVLRQDGYLAAVVERRPVPSKPAITQDLFGAIDVVAIRADVPGVLGIQVTSSSNHAARRLKC